MSADDCGLRNLECAPFLVGRRHKLTTGGEKPRRAIARVAPTIDELRVLNSLVRYGHSDPQYLVEPHMKCILDMPIELFYNLIVFNLDD